MTTSESSLCFFKYFNRANSYQKLKIPTAYTLHMEGTLPNSVYLRDKFGNYWQVKVENVENELYFQDGWSKFVDDNSLETGDFIFFQYHGHGVIGVQFASTRSDGCYKIGVGEKKEEFKGPSEDSCDEEKEEDEEEQIIHNVKTRAGKKSKSVVVQDSNDDRGIGGSSVDDHRDGEIYGADIFRSGMLPQPRNPYFVAQIRPKRREELYIPVLVVEDFNLKLPPEMTLRDEEGRTWDAKVNTWSDGRLFISGGWGNLCRANDVKDDDTCICEFLQASGPGGLLVLQIQILRAQPLVKTSRSASNIMCIMLKNNHVSDLKR